MNTEPGSEPDRPAGCCKPAPDHPAGYALSSAVFLRALGVVQLIALGGLFLQLDGLVGSAGITPAALLLDHLRDEGISRLWKIPTVFWLDSSDSALTLCLSLGLIASIAVSFGVGVRLALLTVWVTYLSFASVGWIFLRFQWDSLLLETTFAALFVASPGARTRAVGMFLVRCLLFRLMFCSGAVKLSSGDPEWRSLSALTSHYLTQPLPNVVAYYLERFPFWFHALSAAVMFVIELVVPFLIWFPSVRVRRIAAALLILFQLILCVTGNFAFLNLLTIVLCITVVDDQILRRLPFLHAIRAPVSRPGRESLVVLLYGFFALLLGAGQLVDSVAGRSISRNIVGGIEGIVDPFHLVNGYGLFAVMTTERREIEIEGSMDGETWLPYRFRWKPDDVRERPRHVAPYQPRLDWQMWFAALGDLRANRWILELLRALLEGRRPVLSLLESAPFETPPRFVRALLFRYEFSRLHRLEQEGVWWKRELIGVYCPPVSLETFAAAAEHRRAE